MTPPTPLQTLADLRDPALFEAAWERFQTCYQTTVERWCRRSGLQTVDAEDVAQKVFLSLLRKLPSHVHDPAKQFRCYLRTTVKHAVCDFHRAQKRHPLDRAGDSALREQLAQHADPLSLDAAEESQTLELFEAVEEFVRGVVEDPTWNACWSVKADGRPVAEVAAELGLSVAAVYKAVHRVVRIGQRLAQQFPGSGALPS